MVVGAAQKTRVFSFELRIWQEGDDDDDDDDDDDHHYSSRITIMNTTHMKHCIGVHIIVGGFNPILKNMLVNIGSSSPIFGVKTKYI